MFTEQIIMQWLQYDSRGEQYGATKNKQQEAQQANG